MDAITSKMETEETTTLDDPSTSLPYYLENFRFIIQSIAEDFSVNQLLSEDPFHKAVLQRFEALETSAQRLFIRLFLRKHVWLRRDKIKYDGEFGSTACVDVILKDLCSGGFLEDRISSVRLEDVLVMLSLTQMKELAKRFRIGTGNPSKTDLVMLTLKKVREQRNPFGAPLVEIVLNAAVALMGKVYRFVNVLLWLIAWLTEAMIHISILSRIIDRLIDWWTDQLFDWLIDPSIDRLIDWSCIFSSRFLLFLEFATAKEKFSRESCPCSNLSPDFLVQSGTTQFLACCGWILALSSIPISWLRIRKPYSLPSTNSSDFKMPEIWRKVSWPRCRTDNLWKRKGFI